MAQSTTKDLQSTPNISLMPGSMLHGNILGEMAIHCGANGGGVNQVVDIGNGQITLPYGAVTFIDINPQHSRPLSVNITCQPPQSVSVGSCRRMY